MLVQGQLSARRDLQQSQQGAQDSSVPRMSQAIQMLVPLHTLFLQYVTITTPPRLPSPIYIHQL